MRNKIAALLLAFVTLAAATTVRTKDGFLLATAPYAFSFPRDHYAHDAYRTEWWYFTGHLRAADGHRFGYELTFFRIGLAPHPSRVAKGRSAWRAAQLYPAHFAITDETKKQFVYYETFARDALGQGYASQRRLDVRSNGWTLTGTAQVRPVMHLHARSGNDALDLVQVPEKPPAINGRDGISRKGSCVGCASHYYSFTRLATTGTLVRDGVRYAVHGLSWMDHEYGSDELQRGQVGWDWFSIQLADRREIMLYRLRQRNGRTTPQSSGSLIAPNGSVRYLPLSAFTIVPTGTWTSPHTHAVYPSGWRLRVQGVRGELILTPTLADQELANPGGTTYWEGAVRVTDARTGARLGVGYVELTGYAEALQL